jgi:methionyl-tRNA formyltransferase
MTSLRVGFAGTPAFAARSLTAILDAGFSVPVVLTRPDKPKGRGHRPDASEVKRVALAGGVAIRQPASLRVPDAVDELRSVALDVLVVAAYGLILPPDVLAWPRHGCLNIHASALPRWRGAAPIQRAIEAGDRSTGVTLMQMDAGLDTGPIVSLLDVAIHPRETGGSLHDKLAALGAKAIVDVLRRLAVEGRLDATPQPATGATYAKKIEREESRIDWSLDAETLDRRIRAFEPHPGSFTHLAGERVKVRTAVPVDATRATAAGTLLSVASGGIDVACGRGALRIVEIQPAGGRPMGVGAFLAGRALMPGLHAGELGAASA